jgi:Fe-S oxidoreductase
MHDLLKFAITNLEARVADTISIAWEGKEVPGYQPPQLNRQAIVQGHCHHKAIMRFNEEKSLMTKMGLQCEVLESGCCGMAGSFGYEKDKYDVSVACGERDLLPRVRREAPSTIIMGFQLQRADCAAK